MIAKRDPSLVPFFRSVPVFHDLKGQSLEVLFDYLEMHTWTSGERIFAEGDLGRTMYVIREGEVEVVRSSSDGEQVPIVRLGAGETFGEMTLVELQPRSASVIARKKTVTYSLTNLDLWNLYKHDNFTYVIMLQNICRMMSRRLRKADSRIADFLAAGTKGTAKKPVKRKKS